MIDKDFKQEALVHDGIYRGVVVDVADPMKRGRVRVKVFELMYGMDDSQLASIPWAVPAMPVGVGAGIGFGAFSVPELGTNVFVFFEGQRFTSPVYFASAVDGIRGVPGFASTDYPYRRGIKYPDGTQVFVDTQTGVCELTHKTGTILRITADGSVEVQTIKDATMTVAGNVNISAMGTGTVHSTEPLAVSSDTAITITAPTVGIN